MSDVVALRREGSIGIVTVDNPPVNAISHAVRQGLVDRLTEANSDSDIRVIMIICAGRTFMAGADIKEFDKPWDPPGLPEVVSFIESLGKPVVAAIHGTALGGGFEVALGCHYRCAVSSARVGFPEVNLGLLPGAHGTQRLPRLIGTEAALDIIISGKPVPAPAAAEMGIIDEIFAGDLETGALKHARRLAAEQAPPRRISQMEIPGGPVPQGFFSDYRHRIAERTRGYFAPERIVQALEAANSLSFDAGVARERELFEACKASPESAAQRHVFFGEREVARIPDVTRDTPLREIREVGIIGGGTMGSGIAIAFADAGFPVFLREADEASLTRAGERLDRHYLSAARKGRISDDEARKRRARIHGVTHYSQLDSADLIIEAVFESMALKKEVFAALDQAARPGAILATNTSTLDVDEIAAVTSRPEDVVGLHFFSPAHVMRLLEIVRGRRTSVDVLATAMKLARQIRKLGVVSGVCFGFIGNRMFASYMREVNMLALEGAEPQRIDRALEAFGFRLGPCAVIDLAGIDVGYKVRQEHTRRPDDPRYGRVEDALYEADRYGQKNGKGFYLYEDGSYKRIPDPDVEALIRAEAEKLGVQRREVTDEEIVQRCVYTLVNEGARILEEGIALRPVDIDMVWINGYGFPPFKGGPMFHADALGLRQVRDTIEDFAARTDDVQGYWTVAPLLQSLAEAGQRFADWKR